MLDPQIKNLSKNNPISGTYNRNTSDIIESNLKYPLNFSKDFDIKRLDLKLIAKVKVKEKSCVFGLKINVNNINRNSCTLNKIDAFCFYLLT